MNNVLKEKLKKLPNQPGVYFHKNTDGEIIYVGKAAVLKNRVRQYFQKSTSRDPKTELLVSEIADTDWQIVESEIEALFLEAEMIKRYMPKYNILLRDDKSMTYVRINFKDEYPNVTFTRGPVDDGADYFGPFLSGVAVKKALRYLRKIFPYSTHVTLPKRACLHYHIGLCPGPETNLLDPVKYKQDLKQLVRVMKGQRIALLSELEKQMKRYAKNEQFEQASKTRNQLFALKRLGQQIVFSDKEFLDISKDHALIELTNLLGLAKPPRRIEGYDISHMYGTDTVASMVVFSNGVSDKANYRKFKSRISGNDDFAHMREAMTRRFSDKNIKAWGMPSLLLIDGGKGQLESALSVLKDKDIKIPAIGLAKKYEEIVIANSWPYTKLSSEVVQELGGYSRVSDNFTLIDLPNNTNLVKLLQRIRDESHRFAVSYHTVLKRSRQTRSLLDEIPGIGPITKKKLLKTFGSVKDITQASTAELAKVVGSQKATQLNKYLQH